MSALTPNYRPVVIQPERNIGFGAITNSYQQVGPLFDEGIVWLGFISTLDQSVKISLDGSTDFITIKGLANVVIDMKTNHTVFPGWMGIYVKYLVAPVMGSLFISAIGIK